MLIGRKTLFKLLASVLFAFATHQSASAQCAVKPLKPIPPLGCKDVMPQCISSNGRSSWNWVCVPQGGGAEVSNGLPRQSPAPERNAPKEEDQNILHAAPVTPAALAPQAPVEIRDDSKDAVKTLRLVAKRIEECPKEVLGRDLQWGKKKSQIVRTYQEVPVNLVWDVVPGNSVRAPYLGYVEFTAFATYYVPESEQSKFLKSSMAMSYLKSMIGNYGYRYEYDVGPDGIQLTRALWRFKNSPDWKELGKPSELCADQAARETHR